MEFPSLQGPVLGKLVKLVCNRSYIWILGSSVDIRVLATWYLCLYLQVSYLSPIQNVQSCTLRRFSKTDISSAFMSFLKGDDRQNDFWYQLPVVVSWNRWQVQNSVFSSVSVTDIDNKFGSKNFWHTDQLLLPVEWYW